MPPSAISPPALEVLSIDSAVSAIAEQSSRQNPWPEPLSGPSSQTSSPLGAESSKQSPQAGATCMSSSEPEPTNEYSIVSKPIESTMVSVSAPLSLGTLIDAVWLPPTPLLSST